MEFKHVSVLYDECMKSLNIHPDGIYVDGTLGGGGHASGVCANLSQKGIFFSLNWIVHKNGLHLLLKIYFFVTANINFSLTSTYTVLIPTSDIVVSYHQCPLLKLHSIDKYPLKSHPSISRYRYN